MPPWSLFVIGWILLSLGIGLWLYLDDKHYWDKQDKNGKEGDHEKR